MDGCPSIFILGYSHLDEDFILSETILDKINDLDVDPAKRETIKGWLASRIYHSLLPALQVPSQFGNMYSASLWAQIMFLVESGSTVDDTIYFGSYGSGATCISGLLKIQRAFKSVVNQPLSIQSFLENRQQITVEEYENIRNSSEHTFNLQFIKDKNYSWCKVEPIYNAPELDPLTFNLSYCDKGCNISNEPGLDYCPQGHPGKNSFTFPLIGIISELNQEKTLSMNELFSKGFVPITHQSKYKHTKDPLNINLGDLVEFNFYKFHVNPSKHHLDEGLLNWSPIYEKISHTPYYKIAKALELEYGTNEAIISEREFY